VQALVLRDNGYRCDEAVIYYVATKQRVRIAVDEALVRETLEALEQARQVAASGRIPPPLEDSPKCPRCSLVGICLPDETRTCQEFDTAEAHSNGDASRETNGSRGSAKTAAGASEGDIHRLVPARDQLRPLYLNTHGLRVGKAGAVLKVHEKD